MLATHRWRMGWQLHRHGMGMVANCHHDTLLRALDRATPLPSLLMVRLLFGLWAVALRASLIRPAMVILAGPTVGHA